MPTLEERLGDAIEAAFQAGNTLLNTILQGSGATLNTERTLTDDVQADHNVFPGWCKIVARTPRPLRGASGGYANSMRTTFVYDVTMGFHDDIGQDNVTENVFQTFVQTVQDAPTFFGTHVSDVEGNLHALDGDIEIEPLVKQGDPAKPEYTTEVRITVWHKQALTE